MCVATVYENTFDRKLLLLYKDSSICSKHLWLQPELGKLLQQYNLLHITSYYSVE